MRLFHITTRAAWEGAAKAESYAPPSLAEVGFIHLSLERQWRGAHERFFAGASDLLLLEIDPARLRGEVRMEAADGDVFPHLYAPLNVDAVVTARALTDPGPRATDPSVRSLYPLVAPHDAGVLEVGDGNAIAWEVSGRVDGKPAVVLHGGPGQGCSPNMRRAFDPERYRVVLFDQRGCGRSTPHASHPSTEMRFNTTQHLVADIEALRAHLGVDRWLVSGGSWGATLALAYAERHPSRVSELVLSSVMTGRRSESAWLYGGLSRFFPEAAERFRGHVLVAGTPIEAARVEVVAEAYARLLEDPARAVRVSAARAWCDWEEAILSLEPAPTHGMFATLTDDEAVAFARVCAHYVRHGAWLDEGELIREAERLEGLPGVIIHGRRDLTCPVESAHLLSRRWPDARLMVLDDSGHLGSPSKRRALLDALDGFATRGP